MLRFLVASVCALVCFSPASAAEPDGPIYELRIYNCEPGKLPALEERFQDHTIRMFQKHGIKNLAYWVPLEMADTLIYMLEHESQAAAEANWEAFRADPEWKQIAADSAQKHGKILARPPESLYLVTTDYSPQVDLPPAGKVYELRTYTAATGRFDDLNKRFREHTDRLFQKHGMTAYGYWVPADAPKSADTLIYILEFPSMEAATASWTAFRDDPQWQTVYKESQKDGSLTATRPDSVYMRLTPFSPVAK